MYCYLFDFVWGYETVVNMKEFVNLAVKIESNSPYFQNFRPVSSQRSMNSAVALPNESAPTSLEITLSLAAGRF